MANESANLRDQPTEPSPEDRLGSWKEIAAYLKCSERTVRRWEQGGLPVHRHPYEAKGNPGTRRQEHVKKLRFRVSAVFSCEKISIRSDMSEFLGLPGHFPLPRENDFQFFHMFL